MNDLENSLGDVTVDEKCYKVAKNSELGRHIVVTKALKKGDIIFKDHPLVTGPSRESQPCCVACYKLLDLATPSQGAEQLMEVEQQEEDSGPVPHVRCDQCQWPLCSVACSRSSIHQAECHFLSKVR